MALGYKSIPTNYIRVKCFSKLVPRDGTVELVHTVPINPKTYFSFLSDQYAAPHKFESKEELIDYIKREKKHMLEEVQSVICGDGMDNYITS